MGTKLLYSVLFVFLLIEMGSAQSSRVKTVRVKGEVTDAQGFPVHKADIFVDSLKTGMRTNKKGGFKLLVPVGTDVISIFSETYGFHSEVYDGQEKWISFSLKITMSFRKRNLLSWAIF